MKTHYVPKPVRQLKYYARDVDGMPLVPWKYFRRLMGNRYVDKFKAWQKKKKRKFYPKGAWIMAIWDYLQETR